MKDTTKLVVGVTVMFTAISAVAIYFNGSVVVSVLSSLAAVALSLVYKYKCERDNILDTLNFMQKTIVAKNNRINILEPRLLQEVGALGIGLLLRLHFNDRLFGNFAQCHRIQQAFPIRS